MLNWLRIKNLALVEKADIEFGEGFNVITGETGAGKSVIMGTMGLLLGERADRNSIRTGADRCEVSGGITLNSTCLKKIAPILDESGIEFDGDSKEIQIRRVITPSNTRNFINDTPVTLQTLKSIGDYLIDIHGANEHQSLFKQATQLELLDRYGNLSKELGECVEICKRLSEARKELEELNSELPSSVEAEHLRLIVSEIEEIDPQPNEDEELSARHSLAANSKQLIEVASKAVFMLNDSENSLADNLSDVYRELQEIERIDSEKGASFTGKCDFAMEQIRELAYDLEAYSGNVELDEQEFMELEERMSAIQTLKRRYGPNLENVFDALDNAAKRLELFDNAEAVRNSLLDKEQKLLAELKDAALKLSKKRSKAADKLAGEVTKELKKLGFLKCGFSVELTDIEPGPNGCDRIDFIFSPNPGEAPQPLRNIASSGEMSRVMLALKTVLAEADSVPILIFDEIDVNIGGETALKVGEGLRKLSKSHQLICISHLPQVAACGDRHYMVSKRVVNDRTFTSIKTLDYEDRHKETTRMLGGGTAAAAHAEELLKA